MTADFNTIAASIGELVTAKNEAYGDSFAKCGQFLQLLYPHGIPPAQYADALAMVRIFDKQMRIATRKDAFGESPYRDIAGYGILGAAKDERFTRCHSPLSPEEVEEITASIITGCQDDDCKHRNPAAPCNCQLYGMAGPTFCKFYREAGEEKEVERISGGAIQPPLCNACAHDCCTLRLMAACGETGKCDRYASKLREQIVEAKEPQPLDLSLPSIVLECTAEEARQKYLEERAEWLAEHFNTPEEIVEMWDVLQAAHTWLHHADVRFRHYAVAAIEEAERELIEREGVNVMLNKPDFLRKNALRGYYAPEVNQIIIESNGERFTP